jgi:hypothetical protein
LSNANDRDIDRLKANYIYLHGHFYGLVSWITSFLHALSLKLIYRTRNSDATLGKKKRAESYSAMWDHLTGTKVGPLPAYLNTQKHTVELDVQYFKAVHSAVGHAIKKSLD